MSWHHPLYIGGKTKGVRPAPEMIMAQSADADIRHQTSLYR